MFRSLRFRLTAWYLLFFTALLVAFCGFLYALLARHLHQRLDATLMADANTAVGLVQDEILEHQGDVPAAVAEVANEIRSNGTLIAVFENGRLLGSSDSRTAAGLAWVVAARGAQSRPFTLTLPGRAGTESRAAVLQFASGGRRYSLLSLVALTQVAAQLEELRRVFYIALPLALLIAGIGGFLLAARSLAPLLAISEQTARIGEKNLHERLQVGRPSTELSQLAAAFNDLLERLDRSFETMRRFMADASHELRTPLSVIRGETDVTLSRDRSAEEYRGDLEIIREEAKRLSLLVDDLLNLARADAGHRPLRLEEFYLDDLVKECCRSVEALAGRKRIEVTWSCPEDVGFRGDRELMRRLIVNLLDNGIRYTPGGGAVSVRVETQEARIRLMVSDTGRGIPPESAERIFERFYRVDQSRSRGDGGFGLGLPIAKWVAESHRGAPTFEHFRAGQHLHRLPGPLTACDDRSNRSLRIAIRKAITEPRPKGAVLFSRQNLIKSENAANRLGDHAFFVGANDADNAACRRGNHALIHRVFLRVEFDSQKPQIFAKSGHGPPGAFSPMPPANTSVSSPPSAAANAPIHFLTW